MKRNEPSAAVKRETARTTQKMLLFIRKLLVAPQQMSCRCYLEQAEHGVAYVEAVPPVVVGDGTVPLPHCVHPPGQCLRGREGGYYPANKAKDKAMRMKKVIISEGFQMSCDLV